MKTFLSLLAVFASTACLVSGTPTPLDNDVVVENSCANDNDCGYIPTGPPLGCTIPKHKRCGNIYNKSNLLLWDRFNDPATPVKKRADEMVGACILPTRESYYKHVESCVCNTSTKKCEAAT